MVHDVDRVGVAQSSGESFGPTDPRASLSDPRNRDH